MQKMTILCTGKLKEKFYLDAALLRNTSSG